MNFVDRLAEARIDQAVEQGMLDDLPGAGQPLPADEALRVPAELRAAYRLLRNAGYVPPEIVRARDINALRDLLTRVAPDSTEAEVATRRLRWLELALATNPRGSALLTDAHYGARIRRCLGR